MRRLKGAHIYVALESIDRSLAEHVERGHDINRINAQGKEPQVVRDAPNVVRVEGNPFNVEPILDSPGVEAV